MKTDHFTSDKPDVRISNVIGPFAGLGYGAEILVLVAETVGVWVGRGVKVEVGVGVKLGVAVKATSVTTAPLRGAPVTRIGWPVVPLVPEASPFPAMFA